MRYFISPTLKKKDLVLGFSVFLSLFLLLLWGSSELGTNGGERWVWFGFEGQTPPPLLVRYSSRRRHRGIRDSAFERTPVVVFFFKKGVARTKVRFVRVLVRVPTYDVCTIKHARCYFLLLLLLLPNSRPRRLQR